MKTFAALLLAVSVIFQSSLTAEAKASSALLGAWAVDTSKLPLPPAARPKSVIISFSAEGSDQLRTKVEVVDPTGSKLEAEGVTPLDGSPTPVKSNFEADVSATTMPRPEVLIMQLAKSGSPASTRIYAVSPDGNSMIETVAYFDRNGQPVLRKNYFSRIR